MYIIFTKQISIIKITTYYKKCTFVIANLKTYMTKTHDETDILLEHIINAINNIKGEEIITLDLRKIESAICKYFVICTGTSNTHVNSIEQNIKKLIRKEIGEKCLNTEGSDVGEWILIDYSDIMIHIFQKKFREFYNLEELWGDAKLIIK